jgi:tetraacyldisaccharide-1-P 4'-kinase
MTDSLLPDGEIRHRPSILERADALMLNEHVSWIGTSTRLYEMVERLSEALEKLRNPMGEPRTEEAVLVQIEVAEIATEALYGD